MPDYFRGIGLISSVSCVDILKATNGVKVELVEDIYQGIEESVQKLRIRTKKGYGPDADWHVHTIFVLRRVLKVRESNADEQSLWVFARLTTMLRDVLRTYLAEGSPAKCQFIRLSLPELLASVRDLRERGVLMNIGALTARITGETKIGTLTFYAKSGSSVESSDLFTIVRQKYSVTPRATRIAFSNGRPLNSVLYADGYGNYTLGIHVSEVDIPGEASTLSAFSHLVGDCVDSGIFEIVTELPLDRSTELASFGGLG